jgi:phosphatidylserine decarboxylase
LIGTSPFGYLAMILVGALNVGSIDINFDKNLQTNKKGAIYK